MGNLCYQWVQVMDIAKNKPKKNYLLRFANRHILIPVVLLMAIIGIVFKSSQAVSVSREKIVIEKVRMGDLDVVIDGYGSLKSSKQRLISSLSKAKVNEILLKPGAVVTAESVIVILDNPELVQEVKNIELEIEKLKANLRLLQLKHEWEYANEAARIAEIGAGYEKSRIKRIANEKLLQIGVVSKIRFQEILLDENRWKKQEVMLNKGIKHLEKVHREAVKVELERIKQQEGLLEIARSKIDELEVKAGMDGVMQELYIEIGQSLDAGSDIALIGSSKDLIALVKVSQNLANSIVVGQKASVDTRRDHIIGNVSRIDPIVVDNTVEIEIELPDDLPPSARPQLNVNAKVFAEKLTQVMYIARPSGVRIDSRVKLFKVDPGQKLAILNDVQFGRRAGDYIEIVSGAKVNDLFIISGVSNLENTTVTIGINK